MIRKGYYIIILSMIIKINFGIILNVNPENNSISNQIEQNIFINTNSPLNTSTWINWDNSKIAYWNFDIGNSTHTYDLSGRNNDLTHFGGYSNNVDSIRGNYSYFDGINDYMKTNNSLTDLEINFPITMSLWFKGNNNNGYSYIGNFGENGQTYSGYSLMITSSGTIYSRVGSGGGTCNSGFRRDFQSSNVINSSKWEHIVIVFNSLNSRKLYINGERKTHQYNSGSANNLGYATNSAFRIGGASDTGCGIDDYSKASFDEIIIFNREVQENEVKSIYDSQKNDYIYNTSNLLNNTLYNYTVYYIDSEGTFLIQEYNFFINTSYIPQLLEESNNISLFPLSSIVIQIFSILTIFIFLYIK